MNSQQFLEKRGEFGDPENQRFLRNRGRFNSQRKGGYILDMENTDGSH